MYTDRDMAEAQGRVRRVLAAWLPVIAALLMALVAALVVRVKALAYVSGAGLFIVTGFGFGFFLCPRLQYRQFLRDMNAGLAREMRGVIVSVAPDGEAEPHDGAWVLQVHILLDEEQDERIVYLNRSKREMFPPVGTHVRLKLYGRHIREAERLDT